MEGQTMFLVCPAYLDSDGARRCGLPAEVEVRYTMRSTDGPLESAKIRCPRGHGFNGPIEFLTIQERPTAPAASVASASTNNAFAEVARDGAKGLGPITPAGDRPAGTGRFPKKPRRGPRVPRQTLACGDYRRAAAGR
jgi:hypothetical protein